MSQRWNTCICHIVTASKIGTLQLTASMTQRCAKVCGDCDSFRILCDDCATELGDWDISRDSFDMVHLDILWTQWAILRMVGDSRRESDSSSYFLFFILNHHRNDLELFYGNDGEESSNIPSQGHLKHCRQSSDSLGWFKFPSSRVPDCYCRSRKIGRVFDLRRMSTK